MSNNMHEESSGPIKSGSQFFWIAVASFVVPFFTIIALVSWVDAGARQSPGTTDRQAKVEARIQPVSQVQIGSDGAADADADADAGTQAAAAEGDAAASSAAAGDAASGQEVYEAVCAACHGTGVAGAPKLGDNDAWAPRIETGFDALLHSALEGKGAMPPQGGGKYSDAEIGHAVVYMANESGGDLSDPGAADEAAAETADAPAEETADAPAEAEAAPAAEKADEAAADDTAEATNADAKPAEEQDSAAAEKTGETETADNAKAAAAGAAAASGAAAAGDEAAPEQAADDAKAADAGAATTAGVDLAAGQALYEKACAACHGTGVAGAPKLGDKDGWEPRIAEGMDAMMHIAINGKGAMPPRGATTASDEELRDAVLYMVNEVDPDFVKQQSAQ